MYLHYQLQLKYFICVTKYVRPIPWQDGVVVEWVEPKVGFYLLTVKSV